MKSKIILLGLLGVAGAAVVASAYTVNEGQQALVLQYGEHKETITEPGLHWKLPVVQQVVLLDKRALRLDTRNWENVLSSDQKRMVVDAVARFKIADPLRAFQAAYSGGGTSIERGVTDRLGQILEPAVREILGKHTLSDIVSGGTTDDLQNNNQQILTLESVEGGKRTAIMHEIRDVVNASAAALGVEIVDVRLKRVDLPRQNNLAIFNRMIAERAREAKEARAIGDKEAITIRAETDLRVAEITSQAERIAAETRGKADGEAVRIFAEAYGQDVDFFEFYRTMEAYRKSLGKDSTTMVMSPNGDFLNRLKSIEGDKKKK